MSETPQTCTPSDDLEEVATVIAVDKIKLNNNTQITEVTLQSSVKSLCGGCMQADTCTSGQIAKAFGKREFTNIIKTELNLKVGDQVLIGVSNKHLLVTAWQVYLYPIIGLILCSAGGQYLLNTNILSHEIWALLMGISGGHLGFLLAKYREKSRSASNWLKPKILKVL